MTEEKEQRPGTIGLAKADTKEREDAQKAKEEADPAVEDPAYMPNIEPQTGDSDS